MQNKAIFRENSIQKLKKSAKQNRFYKSSLVNIKLLIELQKKKRQKILFYYPLELEVNLIKVLQKLRRKHEIYLPFMVGVSFKMVPFRLPLTKKKFGILEAGNTHKKIKNIDIAIVPIVGIDKNLQRVGFGKGMYDRFFEKLDKKPYIIFTQLELCYTKEAICDVHDISCNLLLTPKKTIRK